MFNLGCFLHKQIFKKKKQKQKKQNEIASSQTLVILTLKRKQVITGRLHFHSNIFLLRFELRFETPVSARN